MADDMRADLEAAFAEHSADLDDTADLGGVDPEASVDQADSADQADNQEDKAKPEAGARVRDEAGKFAKAAEAAATIEPGSPAGQEPLQEAIPVPLSLPAPVKAIWNDLPAEAKTAFAKLEGDVQTAKAEWGRKGERLNRFDELIAPRRERLALSGLDEFSAIQTLFAAQDLLERNPVEGLTYLARSYGVNLANMAPQMSAPGQAQAPLLPDAALQPFMQRVQTLEQEIAQQRQAAEAATLATYTSEIQAFRSDPAHVYFDNVQEDMLALLQSGRVQTLKDAYEAAIWASPVVRPILIKEQSAQAQRAQAETAQRERAASAKRAAGSVTGAPGSAASPPAGNPNGSIKDDLRAAWEEHAA